MTKTIVLGLFGSFFCCVATSAQDVLTLRDNEKAGEVLVVKQAKVLKLTKGQKSPQALAELSKTNKSVVVYFDDASDGTVGFIGTSKIAFASNKFGANMEHTKDAQFEKLFKRNKPMPYAEFLEKYQKKPPPPWPEVPVQVTAMIQCVFLSNRPSNYIALKSERGICILEIVAVAKDKSDVKLKIHTGK